VEAQGKEIDNIVEGTSGAKVEKVEHEEGWIMMRWKKPAETMPMGRRWEAGGENKHKHLF
jgi:hypothetical protein